jgi:putative transposase
MVTPENKRTWIEADHPNLSIAHQCTLSGLARSSFYHKPSGVESAENLRVMRQIDELYLKRPFYGSPRMTEWLNELGWIVNEKRVARLMRVMGIQAILPGPHTSRPHPAHRVYPYLLRGMKIQAPNEVWCADITYVPLRRGFLYLIAIMDWFSRYVLAWDLSNTQEVGFCVTALQRALDRHGPPEIFNTDQGAQFTSEEFTGTLQRADIRISMDGRGRALDNVFVERLWRTVKYEDVYPRGYPDGQIMGQGLGCYFRFYNTQRRHQALEKRTPADVYFGRN